MGATAKQACGGGAEFGIDGVTTCSKYFFVYCFSSYLVYWEVDLASKALIHSIVLHNPKTDSNVGGITLEIYKEGSREGSSIYLSEFDMVNGVVTITFPDPIVGDKVYLKGYTYLQACEVEVYGVPLDECGTLKPSEIIDGISSDVLDGEDCMFMTNISIQL